MLDTEACVMTRICKFHLFAALCVAAKMLIAGACLQSLQNIKTEKTNGTRLTRIKIYEVKC